MKTNKDLDGRKSVNAIREIARDLLCGMKVDLVLRCGRRHRIRRLTIVSHPVEPHENPFTVHLESYSLEPEELFSDQIIVRSGGCRKTYWRGYEN